MKHLPPTRLRINLGRIELLLNENETSESVGLFNLPRANAFEKNFIFFYIRQISTPVLSGIRWRNEVGKDMVRNYERDQPNVNRLDYYLDKNTITYFLMLVFVLIQMII